MSNKRKADEDRFSVERFYQQMRTDLGVVPIRPSYTGSMAPKLMIVSDVPTDNGMPLARDDYTFLTRCNSGRMTQTYLTTLRKSANTTRSTNVAVLFEEIEFAKPLVVLTIGDDAARALRKDPEFKPSSVLQSGIGIVQAVQCPNGMWFRHAVIEAPSSLNGEFARNAWLVNFEQILKGIERERIDPFPVQILPDDQVRNCIQNPRRHVYCKRPPRRPTNINELYVTQIIYQHRDNTFSVIGKTDEGASVHAKVSDFRFAIYVQHPEIATYDNERIAAIFGALNMLLREENRGSVTVEKQMRRPIVHYHEQPLPFLCFKLSKWSDRHRVLEAYQNITDDAVKVYECDGLTPVKKFMLDRHVYSHGWVRFNHWELSNDDVRADYCIKANVNDMEAFCPNPGDKLVDERWTRMAGYTIDSIDIECIGNSGFFDPAEGSIVCIAAARNAINDPNHPIEIEETRDTAKPGGTEVKPTGESNYTHVSTFVVGDVEPISEGDPFDPKTLPNVPHPPKQVPCEIEDDVQRQYCIREWDAYFAKYSKWIGYVGTLRRDYLFSNCSELADAFYRLRKFDASEEWDSAAQTIVKCWPQRVTDDIATFPVEKTLFNPEHISIQNPAQDSVQNNAKELFGSIQYKWRTFHPPSTNFSFKDERDLLIGFATYIQQSDPDALIGYNVGFDFNGILQRMYALGIPENLTRFPDNAGSCKHKQKHSNQAGGRSYIETALPGRDNSDIMPYFKELKLESTTLNAVALKYLNTTKYELAYSQIRPYIFDGNRRKYLCRYNVKDVTLPLCLGLNFGIYMSFVAMCRLTTLIFVSDVYNRGQESKVYSQYLRKAKTLDGLFYTIHDFNPYSAEDVELTDAEKAMKYLGAFVPESVRGIIEQLILKLDFKSLYPSLIIAQNCGQNTFIPKDLLEAILASFGGIKSKAPVSLTKPSDPKEYVFMVKPREYAEPLEDVPCMRNKNGTYTPLVDKSILALMLIDGLALRNEIKKRASKCEAGSQPQFALNVLELVIKFLNNSAYGVSGRDRGPMALMAVAEMTTTAGRDAIKNCIYRLETVFNARIVGGDTDSAFAVVPGIETHEDLFKPYELNGVTKPFYDHFMEVVNEGLPPPMEIDFEGVMGGGCKMINGKMRYEANLFSVKKHRAVHEHVIVFDPITKKRKVNPNGTLSIKGMQAKRRDANKFTRKVLSKIIDEITYSKGMVKEAFENCFTIVKTAVSDIVDGKVPVTEFIETRQYAKKNPKTKLASNEIARRLEAKGDPNAPSLGDRVSFLNAKTRKLERNVEVKRNKAGITTVKRGRIEEAKASEKAVSVLEFARSDKEIDVNYLLDKLKKSVRKLISVGYTGENPAFGGGEVALDAKMNELFRTRPISNRERVSKDNVLFARYGFKVSQPCGMCKKQSMTPLCAECKAKSEDEHAQFRASLVKDIEDCSETCWTCMRVDRGTKVVCDDLSCAYQIPRGRAEYRLEKYEEALSQ